MLDETREALPDHWLVAFERADLADGLQARHRTGYGSTIRTKTYVKSQSPCTIEIRKIVEDESVYKLVAPTNTTKQMASTGVFKEDYCMEGKDACAPEPETQQEMLNNSLQSHFVPRSLHILQIFQAVPPLRMLRVDQKRNRTSYWKLVRIPDESLELVRFPCLRMLPACHKLMACSWNPLEGMIFISKGLFFMCCHLRNCRHHPRSGLREFCNPPQDIDDPPDEQERKRHSHKQSNS
jgi:hypothetical protein